MRRIAALLLAACSFGCDDEYVIENIDVFTCAWLPYWMATCDSGPVHARALRILEHGIVDAQIDCLCSGIAYDPEFPLFPGYGIDYRAQKLVDGSCLVNGYLHERTEPGANSCPTYDVHMEEGEVVYFSGGPEGQYYVPEDQETCCTGFNWEAFGVE